MLLFDKIILVLIGIAFVLLIAMWAFKETE